MSTSSVSQLHAAIDAAIHPLGGEPKVTAATLNALLHALVDNALTGVQQAATLAELPAPPASPASLYLVQDTSTLYHWDADAAAYVALTGAEGSSAPDPNLEFAPADLVSAARARVAYPGIAAAIAAARPGDTVNLYAPLVDQVGVGNEAIIDLQPDVTGHLHGHDILSPDAHHDIVTFRGGRNVLVGGHATLRQRGTGGTGAWFVGAYHGAVIDATIHDLHLEIDTDLSVGFALFATGSCRYRGNVLGAGRYVARLQPGDLPLLFSGEGSITQRGNKIFWLLGAAVRAEWRGDITALDGAACQLEAGTLVLRQGYLHAETRPAGAEAVVVSTSADTTLILENYVIQGVPGATVVQVGKLVLRGNSAVIGNVVAGSIVDERPATAALPAPAAPAALTLPDLVLERVAEFSLARGRLVQDYETTLDGGNTWQSATSLQLPVPVDGTAADRIGVRVAASAEGAPASAATFLPATGPARYVPGLRVRYYQGFVGWDRNFDFFLGKTPFYEEVVEHAGRFRDPFFNNYGQRAGSLDNFSVLFDAYLRVTEAGTYSFGTNADDIGAIWMGEALAHPTNNNRLDGQAGIHLEPGLHPIRMAFSENSGNQFVDYLWYGPGVNDIINAGRLCLLTNAPQVSGPQRAPAGLLADPDFDQPLGAAWSQERGLDVVNGILLGVDSGFTRSDFQLTIPQLQDRYEVEISVDLAPGAQVNVGLDKMGPATTRFTESGVHRFPATPDKLDPQILLGAENSNLVKVHYVQVIRTPAPVTSVFLEDADARFTYNGPWNTEPDEEVIYRDNEGKYTNAGDAAYVEFTFTGTQFKLWSPTGTDGYGLVHVLIDGQEVSPPVTQRIDNPSGNLTYSWAWYTSPVLPHGSHTVRLASDPASNTYCVFDGAEYLEGGDSAEL